MALIYALVSAGKQRDTADRFGVRSGFRSRRGSDVWREFEFAAPLAAHPAGPALQNSKTYILHKEPGGSWFIDRWTADGAGDVRVAAPAAKEQAPANDQSDSCFTIEIGHASR